LHLSKSIFTRNLQSGIAAVQRGISMTLADVDKRTNELQTACDELGAAVDKGSMGEIVEKNQKLIMQYYKDVLDHAGKSFEIARWSAIGGFVIFIITLVYALTVEGWHVWAKLPLSGQDSVHALYTVSGLGILSGLIVQVFAGVAFYLYQKASDQFGAFHICLERTHRYLVAYKIAEEIKVDKDETLRDLICIMAKAPMISHSDIADENGNTLTA
jgi:hypothetical protein